MRRRTWTGLAVLVAAVVLGAANAAVAEAVRYRGKTSQGLPVGVRTGADGLVQRVAIGWRALCTRGPFRSATVARGPLPGPTPTSFAGRGTYRARLGRGFTARVVVRLRGRQVNSHRWRGRISVTAVILRRGRRYDRCRLRAARWSASVPRLTMDMTSDHGDYIGQGLSYSYRSPQDRGTFSGNRRTVQGHVGVWSIYFEAPAGRRLRPGRFRGAIRYPFNGGRPGLDISGDGRGCNTLTGEFTVHSSSFGRRGRLRSIDVSFVQHCEGGVPALRGRLSFSVR